MRTSKTTPDGTTQYVYDGDKLITEIGPSQTLEFYYDEKDQLYAYKGNAGIFYYIRDSLGNILGLADCNSTLVAKYDYDSFGNTTITYDAGGYGYFNPFRYRGYYFDRESGMYCINGRYYIPEWGRWLTPSSSNNLQVNSITGFNPFAYCNNNPVGFAHQSSSRGGKENYNIGNSSFETNSNLTSNSSNKLNVGWLANSLDTGSNIHSAITTIGTIVNNSYFSVNQVSFNDDMRMNGISMREGVLAFNQFSWGLGAIDIFGAVLSVGLDTYDSVQRGVSTGGVILGATLTAAKSVGMIYANKAILWATTAIGSLIPGGAVIGFVVGIVVCFIFDKHMSEQVGILIDKVAK